MGVQSRIKKYRPSVRIRKSNWYHNLFPHLREYERLQRNADVLCFGSTPAKHAIDFNGIEGVNGFNLAVCPETIFYDFQVLKNYHSYLKKGGMVLFVLCPFTFLKDYYRNENGSDAYLNIRYYPILHRAMIDNFDINLYNQWVLHPEKTSLKAFVRSFIDSKGDTKWNSTLTNPDTPEKSKTFCQYRVERWKKEFHLTDLNPDNIPDDIKQIINGNVSIYKEMKSFIEERGYKYTIIVPPFPDEMVSLLPETFVAQSLFNPIKETGMPYISFYGNEDWLSRDYYQHGFLLNTTGRKKLTKEIISRLQLS